MAVGVLVLRSVTGDDGGALLTAWAEGDEVAGGVLIDRYFSPVCRFFANKLPDDVEDLGQQTFLACVEGGGRIHDVSSFRSYLFAIAHNVLRRHLRGRANTRHNVEGADDLDRWVLADVTPSPSTIVADRKEQRLLLLALRRLTLPQQVALELYFWERMSAAQIGEVLGSPEGTIRTRIRDGRLRLAEHIDALHQAPGGVPTTASDVDTWAVRGIGGQVADTAEAHRAGARADEVLEALGQRHGGVGAEDHEHLARIPSASPGDAAQIEVDAPSSRSPSSPPSPMTSPPLLPGVEPHAGATASTAASPTRFNRVRTWSRVRFTAGECQDAPDQLELSVVFSGV